MDAYVYQADLICEDCALAEIEWLKADGISDSGDSETWPQGPYSDGGGKSDSPQHCDICGIFLENPLTREGENYVRAAIADDTDWRDGKPIEPGSTLGQWREHYSYLFNQQKESD